MSGHQPILRRRSVLQLAAAAGAIPLLGTSARAQARPKPSGQVIIGISQEPTVFLPLFPHIEVDDGIYMSLFSPLWTVDPKGTLLPRLASEIPSVENGGVSPDGLNWRIKLREGVTWHDGKPFTADDVKFTLDLLRDPNFPAGSRAGHERLREITVVSPTEVTWKMDTPFSPYSSILAWTWMVPKHLLEGQSDLHSSPFLRAPVGTGPFKWGDRVPGDHITLVANEAYFGEGPFLERAVYKYVPDLTVLYTQFRTGDIDYIGLQGISADHYKEAQALQNRVIVTNPTASIENFYFNLGLPQFKDRAVREALYMSLDKKSIIEELYYSVPRPTESYLPPSSWAFNADLPKQAYDPEKAKALLDSAGWKPGAGGIREKDGVKLQFTNSTTAGNHLREQAQQLLQQGWQDLGVGMTIKNLPPAVMWGDYFNKSQFETAIVGINFMTGPDPAAPDYFSSKAIMAQGGSGTNTMQYVSPKMDALLQAGGTTLDRAKRTEDYKAIQALLRDDLPFLPIFEYVTVEGTKAGLSGYVPNANVRINCWNVNTWKWA
jgi:peptide/nickel transport system substrate-binding protein